jgi:signal peptidase I
VYRDVYYARPIGVASGRGMDGPLELGDDEYYLVGDNSPVSIDSRNWPAPPGVPAKLLLGKPLLILSAWQEASLLGRSFQVPDPARIRYIR